MKNFTFVGCSITHGAGLSTKDHNYTNIVSNYFGANLENISVVGNSNYNIFMSALNHLLYNSADLMVIQWSELVRHWVNPGPQSLLRILPNTTFCELHKSEVILDEKKLKNFVDTFLLLNHDYQNIITLCNYCKILEKVAHKKTRIVFINGLIPWTEEIQHMQTLQNPIKYFSDYTKSLMSIHDLSDNEIKKFFLELHSGIIQLDKNKWLNMFNPISSIAIDFGNDNIHPGPETHKKIAGMLINHIKND
jgi:lysophospholipase L1-like esterase